MKNLKIKDRKVLNQAIRLYFHACELHGFKKIEPDLRECIVSPGYVLLKDSERIIAEIEINRKNLSITINGIRHSQNINI